MIDSLHRLPGFDALDAEAIAMIVARSTVRLFTPGQIVLPAGEVAETLLACVEGELVDADGHPAPPIFDAPGLLFGLAVRKEHRAGPSGATVLAIAKPHVFTIARECPEFVVGLRDLAGPA